MMALDGRGPGGRIGPRCAPGVPGFGEPAIGNQRTLEPLGVGAEAGVTVGDALAGAEGGGWTVAGAGGAMTLEVAGGAIPRAAGVVVAGGWTAGTGVAVVGAAGAAVAA